MKQRHTDQKGKKVKLALFANDITVYTENPKKSTPKPHIPITNKFSKVTGYKINIKKLYFYILPMSKETETKHTVSFIITQIKLNTCINLIKYIRTCML